MKRSQINHILREGEAFIRSFGFELPPFAYWSPDKLRAKGTDPGGIFERGLGWDITDYGGGDFDKLGLFLFTLRNGSLSDLKHGKGMCYAEKIMISRKDQISPMHRHIVKAEDIINRGGAQLAIELYASDEQGQIDKQAHVTVSSDGISQTYKPGTVLELDVGQSITLLPGVWHAFWGQGGDVLIGEVSTVNNDYEDNIFAKPLARFPQITEDENPSHLLVSEYPL